MSWETPLYGQRPASYSVLAISDADEQIPLATAGKLLGTSLTVSDGTLRSRTVYTFQVMPLDSGGRRSGPQAVSNALTVSTDTENHTPTHTAESTTTLEKPIQTLVDMSDSKVMHRSCSMLTCGALGLVAALVVYLMCIYGMSAVNGAWEFGNVSAPSVQVVSCNLHAVSPSNADEGFNSGALTPVSSAICDACLCVQVLRGY